MKQFKIILGLILFASVTTFAQSPRIKLNQITKDNASGSVLISSPTDSGMVYTRDFYISYGVDTVLIFNGDTIRSVVAASVLSDGVTITGDGTSGNELKVDTATVISTIQGLVDSLLNYVTLTTTQTISGAKTFTSDLNIDAKIALNAGDNNVVIGDGAGASLVSGQAAQNVLIGTSAGRLIDSSNSNVVIGHQALYDNTSGYSNVGIGTQALTNNTSGFRNVANGFQALRDNTTGEDNVAIGQQALVSNISGSRNIANGYQSLRANTTGTDNVAFGYFSFYNLNSGSANQAYGSNAGRFTSNYSNLTNATGSIFIGYNARALENGGTNEIVIGREASGNGSNSVTIGNSNNDLVVMKGRMELNAGDNNVVIGDGAGASLVSGQGIRNVLVGTQAGAVINSGDHNVANGYQALLNNTTGSNNIANGAYALYSNTTGNNNIANGYQALFLNTTGYQNTANGYQALYNNTSGNDNVANGLDALYSNTIGFRNIANGFQALRFNTEGDNNIANGTQALYSNTSGNNNVANGVESLFSLSSGDNNQAYGYRSGRFLSDGSTPLTSATNSLFIGGSTTASANGNTNEIVIGTAAIGNGSNTITIGSASAVSLHTRNYEFDIDQTVSATEDNYVLTYDNAGGQISLEPIALSNSATLDFGSTSAQSSADLTITVTGAADGDVVSLGVPNASVNANTNYTAWVSSANTVTVRFNNYSSGAVDPASGTFKVKVFK